MAVSISLYPEFKRELGIGTINLTSDTLKLMLLSGASFNASHRQKSDVVGSEIANGNGYTTSGQALSSLTWTLSGSQMKYTAQDVVWTASGGNIQATDAVLYDDTTTSDLLIAFIDFDATETASDGNTFTVQWTSSTILTLT